VNVALVQNAQHDVNHRDGDDQQHPQVAQGILERRGGALELGGDGIRQLAGGEGLDARRKTARFRQTGFL
jgi:hypothetical protein